ncbi:hypothetical protein HB774_34435 (plasmid) [Rhizobium leguminosarum bv. viciae]|nr:hypothetical protein HB774_34435 [Rhizobium leguminosarum bv. viciae]
MRFTADDPADYALRRAIAGNPQRTIHHASPGTNVIAAFAGPDDVVAAVPGQPPKVWYVDGRQLKDLSLPIGDRIDLVRSAHGDAVVLQSEDSFEVYNRTWKRLASLPAQGARVSRDGAMITAVDQGRLRQWRIPSWKERKVAAALPEGYIVRGVSPDAALPFLTEDQEQSSAIIVQAESGQCRGQVANADSGRPVTALRGVVSNLSSIAVDPGGSLVATAPADGVVQLWDSVTGELTGQLGESLRKTSAMGVDVDGGELSTGGEDGEVRFWSSRGRQLLKS